MRDLRQKNESLRTQLTSAKEEMRRREKTITKELQGLREQLHSMLAKKKTNAEVALLIDSNGKYLDMRRLFVSQSVCQQHPLHKHGASPAAAEPGHTGESELHCHPHRHQRPGLPAPRHRQGREEGG
ncbi:hypothetical protein EOD39_13902 [Acipenser ruthenus]|uniref:Uncharacterized protein n=1 Tax=Acipenser ruthenus TaxID=7906 RepID=A0A662YMB7_ACIRT|nr:hypothetical protein EOD39_13902 [Acipenser ruthenus]